MSRLFPPMRSFPEGARLVEHPECNGAVVGYVGDLTVKAYQGKRNRPDFWLRFLSVERRDKYVEQWLDGIRAAQARVEAAKVERSKPHDFQVGDILYSTWGYEQTNADFYQVVEVSERSIVIRQVAAAWEGGSHQYCYDARPVPDQFIGEPCRKVVAYGRLVPVGYGQAKGSDSSASRWHGRSVGVTTYA